jgi:hypothetical protein
MLRPQFLTKYHPDSARALPIFSKTTLMTIFSALLASFVREIAHLSPIFSAKNSEILTSTPGL